MVPPTVKKVTLIVLGERNRKRIRVLPLGILKHRCRDDAKREYAYDRDSKIGRLDKAWDIANSSGWTVVSMKEDWKRVFPWEAKD
jgi:hypothetical protein